MITEIEVASKILSLRDSKSLLDSVRRNKQLVQCHGVFDLLHIGHIRHFCSAKKLGDLLVVTITPDRFVNKGPGRPFFPEKLRAEAIAALDAVDYVIINEWPTAIEAIATIKPDLYVKGAEYRNAEKDITGKIIEEETAVKLVGGRIAFTDDITFSSSNLINKYFPSFSEEVTEYLKAFRLKYNVNDILKYLINAQNLSVLVVGEAIIDEYNFCDAIGKAGKEPVLAVKHVNVEKYAGGVLAVANHLADFCNKVTCVTYLGENGDYEDFIRQSVKSNVELKIIYKTGSPTLVKRRYLEKYSGQKLFEVYEMNDENLAGVQQAELLESIKKEASTHDLVVVADYGHGLLEEESVTELSRSSKFLAVNAQANAGNHGFNCITKYPVADYVSVAHRELQLTFRQKNRMPSEHIIQLLKDYRYKNIMVTTGRSGSLTYKSADQKIVEVPAFAYEVKDRVGAGDSVLAITSLCMVQNAPAEVIGFIGNVVGAEAVSIMGNERYIEKVPLMKHIAHLLK